MTSCPTPPKSRTFLSHLPVGDRRGALRALNPQMAAELDKVLDKPRQIRRLDVESASELVGWLSAEEDVDVLREILRRDRRGTVQRAVWARGVFSLDELHQARSAEKPQAAEEINWSLDVASVAEQLTSSDTYVAHGTFTSWYEALDEGARVAAVSALAERLVVDRTMRDIVVRITAEGDSSIEALVKALGVESASHTAVLELSQLECIGTAGIELLLHCRGLHVSLVRGGLRGIAVSDSARTLLDGFIDSPPPWTEVTSVMTLALELGLVDGEHIVQALPLLCDPAEISYIAGHAQDAKDADVLVAEVARRSPPGAQYYAHEMTQLMRNVPGLAPETVATIITQRNPGFLVRQWLADDTCNPPTREALNLVASRPASELSEILGAVGAAISIPASRDFLTAAWQHCPGLAAQMIQGHYGLGHGPASVQQWLAAELAQKLRGDQWPLFIALLGEDVTCAQLLELVKQLSDEEAA